MAVLIEIPTDKRARDVLSVLLHSFQISIFSEQDSVNYGEGFELKFKDMLIRLYDDERSDQVMADIDFSEGQTNWDDAFEKIIKQNAGKGVLKIEIDRHDNAPKEIQIEALSMIEEGFRKENLNITFEVV